MKTIQVDTLNIYTTMGLFLNDCCDIHDEVNLFTYECLDDIFSVHMSWCNENNYKQIPVYFFERLIRGHFYKSAKYSEVYGILGLTIKKEYRDRI